jgi:hypothetical protein
MRDGKGGWSRAGGGATPVCKPAVLGSLLSKKGNGHCYQKKSNRHRQKPVAVARRQFVLFFSFKACFCLYFKGLFIVHT